MKGLCTGLMLIAALALAPAASAVDLAQWTFQVTGPSLDKPDSAASNDAVAEAGLFAATSICNGLHASAATDWTSPTGNGSTESFSANTWATGDYWQFRTSSLGHQGITIAWDQTRSSTGPGTFDLSYSTDGTNFTVLLADYTVLENSAANGGTWNSTTRILNYAFGPVAAPSDLNDLATIWFRLVSKVTPSNPAGTNRIDNIIIAGTPLVATGACCVGAICTLETATDCGTLGGTYQGDGTDCDPNPCLPPPTGACCVGTTCTIETEAQCATLGGNYQGDNSVCEPNPCLPPPTGACCVGPACFVYSPAACTVTGGVYQGDYTTCDPSPCPVAQPVYLSELGYNLPSTDNGFEFVELKGPANYSLVGWSLLVIDGDTNVQGIVKKSVSLGTYTTGSNGLLLIRDAATDLVPPPAPETSVVVFDFDPDIENGSNTFVLGYGLAPTAGTDLDADSDCALDAGTLAGFTPVDSVSYVDAETIECEYADELGGTALGFLNPLAPMALYRVFDCITGLPHSWAGGGLNGTSPGPYNWNLTNFGWAAIGVTHPENLTLDPGIPNIVDYGCFGACCFADGTCQVLIEAACTSSAGTYQGDNSICTPELCPQPPGACCFPDGHCEFLLQAECGGTWLGYGTTCDPNNPCPQPSGACCLADFTCQVLTAVDCTTAGGTYQGDFTTCDPNPCQPPPTGACCRPDHTCEVLTATACATAGGTYQGDDTVCTPGLCGCLGDADCNGVVDFDDINPFVDALSGGTPCSFYNCDIDGSGVVDFDDINPFVDLLSSGTVCP